MSPYVLVYAQLSLRFLHLCGIRIRIDCQALYFGSSIIVFLQLVFFERSLTIWQYTVNGHNPIVCVLFPSFAFSFLCIVPCAC